MARYIDADEFRMWLANERFTFGGIKEVDGVFKPLAEFPSADVAPVVHAHWTYEIDDLFPADSMMICSNCGEYERLGANDNYCGNCGAKMDEEV